MKCLLMENPQTRKRLWQGELHAKVSSKGLFEKGTSYKMEADL